MQAGLAEKRGATTLGCNNPSDVGKKNVAKAAVLKELLSLRTVNSLRDRTDAQGRSVRVPVLVQDADAITLEIIRAMRAVQAYAVAFFDKEKFTSLKLNTHLGTLEKEGKLGKGKLAAQTQQMTARG